MGRFDYLNDFKGGGLKCAYDAGEENGILKEKHNIVLNMLKNNLSIELITKCTGINKEQILKMRQEIKN